MVESAPGRLAFSHALVQHAVAERLSHARRGSLHRRIAEVLEDARGDDPEAAADLARHWAEVAVIDPSASATAAAWAVRAGDIALAAAAADEAIARYEQASALWETTTAGHADALIRLGSALQYKGRAQEADDRFIRANQLATALANPDLQARAAIGYGRRYSYWETDSNRVLALEAALAALPEDDRLLRPTIMALLVTHLISGFNAGEALHRDDLASRVRAVVSEPVVSEETLLSVGQTRIYDSFEDPTELEPVASRLATLAQERNDLRVLAQARFAQALSALDRADMARLETSCDLFGDVATRLDDPREKSLLATARSTIAFVEGRYGDAATFSGVALEEGRASGDFNAELVDYAQGILRAVDMGQAREVLPLLIAATEYQSIVAFAAGTALCAALAGDTDRALSALRRFSDSGFDGLPRGADWLSSMAFLAHACCTVGAEQHAGRIYDALSDQASTAVRVGPLIGWWGPVDHHLGSLALVIGRHEAAERHLLGSLEIERSMGARPFEARTLGLIAVLAHRTEQGSDRIKRVCGVATNDDPVEAIGAAALDIAVSLGADGITEEVTNLLAAL